MDSNADGIGDFKGLMRRLDYLHGLGITAIWLMLSTVKPCASVTDSVQPSRDASSNSSARRRVVGGCACARCGVDCLPRTLYVLTGRRCASRADRNCHRTAWYMPPPIRPAAAAARALGGADLSDAEIRAPGPPQVGEGFLGGQPRLSLNFPAVVEWTGLEHNRRTRRGLLRWCGLNEFRLTSSSGWPLFSF